MRWSGLLACLAISLHGAAAAAQGLYPLSIPTPQGYPAPIYQQHRVPARDGTKLVVHEWQPAQVTNDKPVVLFIHGIGMHGEPYAAIAAGLTSRGLPFVVPDLRGHGRSEGKRGELASAHVIRADLGAVIGFINKRHPGATVVLVGESMGGLLAADYAWRGERPLAGVALLAPAFAAHAKQIILPEIGDLLNPGMVSLDAEARLRLSTREPAFSEARRRDPLALHQVTASYLASIAALQLEWTLAGADLKLPLWVCVGGKEQVVDPAAMKRVFERIGTAEKHKTWRQWDEAYHTLCWDPTTPQLVEELAKWALSVRPNRGR
jgi:alpha-beta hydrolase superfamily lysophospholipase